MKVEFFRHNLKEEDIVRAHKVLKSIFLTTGKEVAEFEEKFARFIGTKYAAGITSCTAALHLSLLSLGIGPGDEVITTPMTFVATANAILHTGAKPVFVDVEADTGNIDANLIEDRITKYTRAILPVHLYGHICDMKAIAKIAKRYKLKIIEDAAHCVNSRRDGIGVGQLSDTACFSFYATKNLTCGEGGAVATNNRNLAHKLKMLRLHGIDKGAADRYTKKYKHWNMPILGWKYNMDNIHAALLVKQIKRIKEYQKKRQEIARQYEEAFSNFKGIKLLETKPKTIHARHLFTILVNPKQRDEILIVLQERGIGVAVNYRPIHLLKYYKKTFAYKKGDFPVAEDIGRRTISIPLYPKLRDKEVNYVISNIKKIVHKFQ